MFEVWNGPGVLDQLNPSPLSWADRTGPTGRNDGPQDAARDAEALA